MTSSDRVPNDNIKLDNSIEERRTRNSLIKTVIILAVVIAVVIVVEVVLEYKLHGRYKTL
jgi:type IV secretory pathway component VirB8